VLLVAALPALLIAAGGITLAAQAANAPQAPDEVNCTLVVPPDPLSAKGLATPYQLRSPCRQSDTGQSAFVQGTIVDPATGQVSVYNPLVVDQGTRPAAAPAVPKVPAGAVVGLWFGFNGDNLALRGSDDTLAQANCVNGLDDSIFGQFAFCNAGAFFTAANTAIGAGKLAVPALGTARDGSPCLSTRDFGLVDMDQSDNVTTTYLFLDDGRTAQNTAANRNALRGKGAKVQVNGSDNLLLDAFEFPALGCTPFTAPDLADPGRTATSLALNELQAAAHQAAPVALVPTNDPMTLVDGKPSVAKTNLYRTGVNMPPVDRATDTPKAYCQNLATIGPARVQLDKDLTRVRKSPDPEAADSLFTFLASRMSGSYDELKCANLLQRRNPVKVITNKDGVAVDARFTVIQPAPSPTVTATANPTASPTGKPTRTGKPSPTAKPTATGKPNPTGKPKPTQTGQPVPPPPPPTTAQPTPTEPAPTDPPTASPTPTDPPVTTQPADPPTDPPTTVAPPGDLPAVPADPALPQAPMPIDNANANTANPGNLPVTGFALGTALLVSGGLLIGGLVLRTAANRRRQPRRPRYQVMDLP